MRVSRWQGGTPRQISRRGRQRSARSQRNRSTILVEERLRRDCVWPSAYWEALLSPDACWAAFLARVGLPARLLLDDRELLGHGWS